MAMLSVVVLSLSADNYTTLWKQVADAEEKDLPKTQMEVLGKIISKARAEREYGQLLKAELMNVRVLTSVTPDSLAPAVERLVQAELHVRGKDHVLAAVYASVLGKVYAENAGLSDSSAVLSKAYFRRSMEHPELLAAHKSAEYVPLVEERTESKWFGNDLLHVIGLEAGDYETLSNYYRTTDLRTAACLSALGVARKNRKASEKKVAKSAYIRALDSLLNVYGDMRIAGEVALARYDFMSVAPDVKIEDKVNYINYALMKWGEWPRMNSLRNRMKQLTQPHFSVSLGDMVSLPDRERVFKVTSVRNLGSLTMTVTRVDVDGSATYNMGNEKIYNEIKRKAVGPSVIQQTRKYIGQPDYKINTDSFTVKGLPVGVYLVEFTSDNKDIKTQRVLYYVSDLYVMTEEHPGNRIRYAVVNATTGQPVVNAKLRLYFYASYNEKGRQETLTTDAKGECFYTYEKTKPYQVWAYTEQDKSCPNSELRSHYSYYTDKSVHTDGWVFTDRAIYRPGQTVHAGFILHKRYPDNTMPVVAGQNVVLTLRDANYKEVEKKTVTTDEFGTASCDFVLPQSGLTGAFTIQAYGYGSASFNVEEYKRPTFMVEFPEVNERYAVGDTVVVTAFAKTYSGVPVQGAKVKYTVDRREAFWWWRYSNHGTDTEVLVEGETLTDNDGAFKVEIPMILSDEDMEEMDDADGQPTYIKHPRFYSFTVSADVTDVGGETHRGTMTLPLGTKPTAFSCNLPEKIEKDSLKTLHFSYCNAAGKEIPGDVHYYIDRSSHVYRAKANEQVNISGIIRSLSSGQHTLKAICGTDTIEEKFVLFSMADKRPCIETHEWFYAPETEFRRDGKPVYVQVGSSDKDVHVFYSVIAGDKVLESGSFNLSNAIHTQQLTYKEEYGDGVLLNYAWVKEGKMYTHDVTIRKPLPDKRLTLKWNTFRDRLTPGQQEEWNLSITKPDGKPADAQLMAVLYDKSLDDIRSHGWGFYPSMRQFTAATFWKGISFSYLSVQGTANYRSLNVNGLYFSSFDSSLFSFYSSFRKMYGSRVSGLRARGVDVRDEVVAEVELSSAKMTSAGDDSMVLYDVVSFNAPVIKKDAEVKPEAELKSDSGVDTDNQVQVRENLNETAFFFPALRTDEQGNVVLRFTLPESVTTWKFMGLAHDKDVNYGLLTAEAIAKKDVMIQPNMPRFLRSGDKATIAAKLFNTSEKALSGTAKLELINPENEVICYTQSLPFNVEAGETAGIMFDIPPSDAAPIYICKVTATGKTFSDGEQHYLPVLPDKELVTNTYPFTQHEPGIKTIDLTRLFAVKDKSNKLTVEYTNNPAWLMIQALPTYSAVSDENAISQTVSYYVNSIGAHIMQAAPHIKTVVEHWRNETGEERSLMSALEKNQELKSLVLNETPWVLDADKESSQKRSLMKFFDETTIKMRLNSALEKMNALQNGDGSWSWWKGMKGSIYMTTAVSEMLVRLNKMVGKQQDTQKMLTNAFRYMDSWLVDEYKEMKKNEKKYGIKHVRPSETAVRILYMYAIDGRPHSSKTATAIQYMVSLLASRTTEMTIYGKATAALILAKNGQQKKAAEYMKSIKEYTVATEELGRYFDTPKAHYSWYDYRIPTQVAAIEALKELQASDVQTVEEMQRWLLQEKRTQSWSTPINSVNAVYAFLDGNMDRLDEQAPAVLKLNGEPLELPQATAGLGYVKTAVTGNDMQTFTVEKTSTGTSWGAVYAQFMQKATDVAAASSGLTVTRELLHENRPLKVGDRVTVRITIKAERDYDFVQVTDKRAACLEPLRQLSGYHWGYYIAPKDYATNYYFDRMAKGTHVVETEYYVDRVGTYETGTCVVQCAYAPEYSARAKAQTLEIK